LISANNRKQINKSKLKKADVTASAFCFEYAKNNRRLGKNGGLVYNIPLR